jgi:erythromycin esterase-like protein
METYKRLQKKASKYQDTLQVVCQQLQDLISSKRSYLERNYSPIQFARLSFCLQNLQQAITNLSVANVVKFRDSCMARNVLQIQQLEHQKMFVWAHNGHVNLSYPEKVSSLMGLPMGGHLKAGLKEQYFAIGFVFNQGSFQAIKGPNTIAGAAFKYIFAKKHLYKGLQACTVPVNEKNTFTNALSHTGYPSYFININNTGNKVFSTDLKTYDIGAVFLNYKRCSDTLNAKKQFDGLIYIDQTTRAMPFNLK